MVGGAFPWIVAGPLKPLQGGVEEERGGGCGEVHLGPDKSDF